ncbi:MAG: hypothetical protein ACJ75Z_03180 [Solirubrobacterales bacterium]
MSRTTALALAALAALATLVIAGAASAAPAVDEYGANLPTAGGNKSQGTAIPQAQPEQLPPAVARRISGASNGKQLSAVATAKELGAPSSAGANSGGAGTPQPGSAGDDGNGKGIVTAAADSLATPLVLLLITGLALSAVAIWRVRRHGISR